MAETEAGVVSDWQLRVGSLLRVEVRTEQGEPWRQGDRTIVPVAREIELDWGRGQARWTTPVALLERTPAGEHRIPIPDLGALIAASVAASAVLLPVALYLTGRVAKRR